MKTFFNIYYIVVFPLCKLFKTPQPPIAIARRFIMDQLSSSSNSNSNSNSSPSKQKGNKLTGLATQMFHDFKNKMGFVPTLTMAALTTIACSPSIPQDIMNMGYAVGGAAAMSSRSVSPPSQFEDLQNIAATIQSKKTTTTSPSRVSMKIQTQF